MSDDKRLHTRRNALKCMAYGGAGTLFALSGGVFTPIDLAMAAVLSWEARTDAIAAGAGKTATYQLLILGGSRP